MKKTLMAGIAAATMMAAAPAAAQTTFAGTTTGCFGTNCAPTASAINGGLTFTGGTFNQTTDNTGFLALGGLSDGLGTFTLSGVPDVYTGDVFRLLVSFTAPTGTNPGSTLYDQLLQGTVTGVNSGGVFVNFDNAVRNFTSSAGPFTFALNDVSISSNSATQIISGQIQAAVPEPGTWGMMLLGFGGMGVALRRRRKTTGIPQLA